MKEHYFETTLFFNGIAQKFDLPQSSVIKLSQWFHVQKQSESIVIDRISGWNDSKPVLVGLNLAPNSLLGFTPDKCVFY